MAWTMAAVLGEQVGMEPALACLLSDITLDTHQPNKHLHPCWPWLAPCPGLPECGGGEGRDTEHQRGGCQSGAPAARALSAWVHSLLSCSEEASRRSAGRPPPPPAPPLHARHACCCCPADFGATHPTLPQTTPITTSPSRSRRNPQPHPQFVPIMGFECRGLEPIAYKPDVFIVRSKGGQTFEADLSEG